MEIFFFFFFRSIDRETQLWGANVHIDPLEIDNNKELYIWSVCIALEWNRIQGKLLSEFSPPQSVNGTLIRAQLENPDKQV